MDGAVNDTMIRVPYQRLDSLKSLNFIQQFMAIAYKKFLFLKNEWTLALFLVNKGFLLLFHITLYVSFQISKPFLLTTMAILIIHSSTVLEFGSGLHLSLNHYKNSTIYLDIADDSSVHVNNFAKRLKGYIETFPGLQIEELSLNNYTNVDDGKHMPNLKTLDHSYTRPICKNAILYQG